MASILFHYHTDTSCLFERFLQPAQFCTPELESRGHTIAVANDLMPHYDWIAFHGLPTPQHMMHLLNLQQVGSKILWSLDDDWTTIPDWNPAKPGEEGRTVFHIMRKAADAILCSTPALAATFHDISSRIPILVAPNLIDLNKFPPSPFDGDNDGVAEVAVNSKSILRVVWSGGHTHKGDIEFLEPVIDKLLTRHGSKRLCFVFMGLTPPPRLLRDWLHRGVLWHSAVPFPQYRRTANTLDPHIWLAPMAEIPFNESKSNLRILEGWGLGAPVVATAFGEYNCIHHGQDGLVCRNGQDWFEAIHHLIMDHTARLQMAAYGRRRVAAMYNWNEPRCRQPWVDAIDRLLNPDREKDHA